MNKESEIYPKDIESGLYYVEFSRWEGKPLEYRLFKRNFLYSKEDLEAQMVECETENEKSWMRMQNEVHPYQLTCGVVNENPNVIAFETKEFLKFTVDSLNKNSTID